MRFLLACLIVAALPGLPRASERAPHPLFSPMAGYTVSMREEQEFAARAFMVSRDGKEQVVEGRLLTVGYLRQDGLPSQSGLTVVANHRNAIQKMGGEIVYTHGTPDAPVLMIFRLKREAGVTWGEIDTTAGGNDFRISTITVAAMKQEVTGKELADGLARDGRVALYGIQFDTGKSTLRPDSEPELKAIADMLKANPSRNVYVVGHTDNVGSLAANLTLSQQRAEAVTGALASRFGIAASRLVAKGVAQLSPVATNASEEGRQRNRRVEIVAQ